MSKTGTVKIKTKRFTLRKIYPWDIFSVYPWYTSEEISRFSICRRAFTPFEAFKLCFGRCLKYHKKDYYYWGIEFKGKIIGLVNVTPYGSKEGRFSLCEKIDFKYNNQGVATECVSAVLDYFKTQDIHEIIYICDVENIASKRVAEKAGMTPLGSPETNPKIKYDTGEIAKTYCFKFLYKI